MVIASPRQAGAYVLDFPGHSSKLSVKNVQLELAEGSDVTWRQRRNKHHHHRGDDDNRHVAVTNNTTTGRPPRRRGREAGAAEGSGAEKDDSLLLSLGKTATDEFGLDFRGPLSPLQAFGIALAALDTKI